MSTGLALTNAEDTFCLGILEYGGNLGAAYRAAFGDVSNPTAKAKLLLTRPEIALRIQELTRAVEEHAYISLGSHLTVLAELRDTAVKSGELKVALAAEVKRGEVAGYYTKQANEATQGGPAVHIHMPQGSSVSIQDWAKKNSDHAPVVIDARSGKTLDNRMTIDNG